MRAFSVCLVLVMFVAMMVGTSGNPVGDNAVLTFEAADQPLTLFDVDAKQGHEHESDRLARAYGGYRGGYGGYRGGYGGYRGGYGGYRGGYGGYRGGYGGYGGRRGGYYG